MCDTAPPRGTGRRVCMEPPVPRAMAAEGRWREPIHALPPAKARVPAFPPPAIRRRIRLPADRLNPPARILARPVREIAA